MHVTAGGKRTYNIPRWDFRKLLLELGPIHVIRDKMFAHGYEPPPAESIYGWRKRNAVPANWVPALIKLATLEGLITTVDDINLPQGQEPVKRSKRKAA